MGVDCIFDGEDLAGSGGPLFSPDDYTTFYASRFKNLSDVIHKNNMLYLRHTDGNIMQFADQFLLQSGFDGYQSIDPSAGMDLGLIKEKYGDKITLMGNVDCAEVLHLGTKEDVIRDTLRVIKTASPVVGILFHRAIPFTAVFLPETICKCWRQSVSMATIPFVLNNAYKGLLFPKSINGTKRNLIK